MDCNGILALLEKLVDSEASAAETREVESHVRDCPSCREHLRFLEALGRHSRTRELPEPPESYWEHLPRKIETRIASERHDRTTGLLGRILAPGVIRLGALAASVVLLVVVGVNVLRDGPSSIAPVSAPESSDLETTAAPETEPVKEEAALGGSPAASPPRPAPPADRELSTQEKESLQALGYVAGVEQVPTEAKSPPAPSAGPSAAAPRPSEAQEGLESGLADAAFAVQSERAPRTEEQEAREQIAGFARNEKAMAAQRPEAARSRSVEDCERWRRMLADTSGEEPSSADVRYALAACSIRALEEDPSAEHRATAIADGEAFLALEGEGTRAEEIRAALTRLREER